MIELGRFALAFSFFVTVYAVFTPIIGLIKKDKRFIKSAVYAIYFNAILLTFATVSLVWAFINNRFDLAYVFQYSNKALPIVWKMAAMYAGQAGSLLYWAWILSIFSAVVVYQNRNRNFDLMPYVMSILMLILTFFVFILVGAPWLIALAKNIKTILSVVTIVAIAAAVFWTVINTVNKSKNKEDFRNYIFIGLAAFLVLMFIMLALSTKVTTDSNPFQMMTWKAVEGMGLNPLLQNYGMLFHPTTLYIGYVGFSVPFAFAMAALISGNLGTAWIVSTRKWSVFAWFFLGVGIVFGAQWAYMELGWGGYWAWDPVENASLMPWLIGTAYMHSVMIQEKKNMLKIWNMMLVIFTFAFSIFGTFLTRSGVLSSVHTFGKSSLGGFFLTFDGLVLIIALILLASRLDFLQSDNELDSIMSREASFLINNLLLIGAAFTVFWGTVFPLLSEWIRKIKITVGPPFYEQVLIPIALVLFLDMAICPLIAWRRASGTNLRKNFLSSFIFATIAGIVIAFFIRKPSFMFILPGLGLVGLASTVVRTRSALEKKFVAPLLVGFSVGTVVSFMGIATLGHPWAWGALFLLTFLMATIVTEYYRGTRIRFRHAIERDERNFENLLVSIVVKTGLVFKALGTLIWKNKRRYGGYIIHTGLVILFVGVIFSSTWNTTKEVTLAQGDSVTVRDYVLKFENFDYQKTANKQIWAANLSVWDAASVRNNAAASQPLGMVIAEKDLYNKFYDDGQPNQPKTEVGLFWNLKQDLYVILNDIKDNSSITLKIKVNPMLVWIWIGGFVMMAGTVVVMWPDAAEKKRLAAKYAKEAI